MRVMSSVILLSALVLLCVSGLPPPEEVSHSRRDWVEKKTFKKVVREGFPENDGFNGLGGWRGFKTQTRQRGFGGGWNRMETFDGNLGGRRNRMEIFDGNLGGGLNTGVGLNENSELSGLSAGGEWSEQNVPRTKTIKTITRVKTIKVRDDAPFK